MVKWFLVPPFMFHSQSLMPCCICRSLEFPTNGKLWICQGERRKEKSERIMKNGWEWPSQSAVLWSNHKVTSTWSTWADLLNLRKEWTGKPGTDDRRHSQPLGQLAFQAATGLPPSRCCLDISSNYKRIAQHRADNLKQDWVHEHPSALHLLNRGLHHSIYYR